MQHANVLPRHDVNQFARLDVPDFDKVGLESKDVRVGEGKRGGIALPGDLPVRTSAPAIAIDKEGKVAVVQQEFAVHPLDVDWLDVFLAGDEIQRSIGLIQKRLRLGGLQTDDLKPTGTAHAKGRAKEVDRGRFRRDIVFLLKKSQ